MARVRWKTLFLGIDGARGDVLKELGVFGFMTGTRGAKHSFSVQSPARSFSGPSWGTLFTGKEPEQHGYLRNELDVATDRTRARRAKAHPHPTLFETLSSIYRRKHAVQTWDWMHSVVGKAMDSSELVFSDDEVFRRVAQWMKPDDYSQPDFIFAHLSDVDHAGHVHGFSRASPEYVASIRKTASRIRQLWKRSASASAPTKNKRGRRGGGGEVVRWVFVLAGDHGGSFVQDLSAREVEIGRRVIRTLYGRRDRDDQKENIDDTKNKHNNDNNHAYIDVERLMSGHLGVHGLDRPDHRNTFFVVASPDRGQPDRRKPRTEEEEQEEERVVVVPATQTRDLINAAHRDIVGVRLFA